MKITINDPDNEHLKWRVVNFDGTEVTCIQFDDETKEATIPVLNIHHQVICSLPGEVIYVTVKIPGAKFERIADVIYINAERNTWNKKIITYEDILDRANKKPGATVIVSYKSTSSRKSKSLVANENAEVEDGMVIDCQYTGAA